VKPSKKNNADTTGLYNWTVSSPATAGAKARIRVTWTENAAATDKSNANFAIVP
jgi:hypothetical protein